MKQIFNDLPKIIPELYLSSSIIKNVTAGLQRYLYNNMILEGVMLFYRPDTND